MGVVCKCGAATGDPGQDLDEEFAAERNGETGRGGDIGEASSDRGAPLALGLGSPYSKVSP